MAQWATGGAAGMGGPFEFLYKKSTLLSLCRSLHVQCAARQSAIARDEGCA